MDQGKKILIVGASGTLGQALVREFGARHTLIRASRKSGDEQVDVTLSASIHAMFTRIGKVDAIVSAAGKLHFGPLEDMTAEQFRVGLHDKFLGQVDLALIGQHYLNEGGSITLTSGIVCEEPIRFGVNATAVNAGIEGFVRAAAVELRHGRRINAVSPAMLLESQDKFGPYFAGFDAVPGARVALAYTRSIEGVQSGRVDKAWS